MTLTDVVKSMDGMGSNPGLLIRAPDYVAPGAEIVYSNSYFEGKAVRGVQRGQKIMESPWFAAGTFNNIVIPMVYIEGASSVTGTGTDASSGNDKVRITIYKRLPGSQTITTTTIHVQYVSTISNKVGMAPHFEHFYRPSWMPTWFDIRYEYKFVMDVYRITAGAALDVEGIYLQYYVANSVMAGRQVTFGAAADAMGMAVPVMGGTYWTATTDGSGNLSIAIPSEYFPYSSGYTQAESATGSAPSTTGLPLKNLLNSVDGMNTTFAGGTDIDAEYLLWNYEVVDGLNGGYTLYIGLHSDNASAQYWCYTTVYGYVGPLTV
jgi:hypothetical protein